MTAEQLAEAQRYNRQQLICDLADRLIDVVFLVVITFLAVGMDRWLAGFGVLGNVWFRLAAMFLLVTALHLGVSFPLSFFSGHLLEHRYGMSNQSAWRWLRRYGLRHLLGATFNLLMIEGLYLLIYATGPYWFLAAAGAMFLISVVMGQVFPVLILPIFYKIERLPDETVAKRLSKLSEGTGLNVEGVYRMQLSTETVKANAMLAGIGRTRRVILGDTLLDEFAPEEIDVVFAHEVGHHVHRHIYKILLVGLILSPIMFYLFDQVLHAWLIAVDGAVSYTPLSVHALPLLMLFFTLFGFLTEPLMNGISRHFERQADRYALDRTQHPDAYIAAFSKLAKINKADPNPHPLEVFFFHSHPPITERLAMAKEPKK